MEQIIFLIKLFKKMLASYIKRVGKWIWKGKFFWLMILLIVLTSIYILQNFKFVFHRKDIISGFALFLQIVGSYIVVLSLKQKMILFKGHGLIKLLMNYFRDFPSWGKRKISVKIAGSSSGFSTITGKARIDIDPNENFKDIIIYFRKQISDLYQRLEDNRLEILNALKTHKEDNEAFHKELSQEIKQTRKMVADSSVSNISLELFGIGCIFLGTILGALANVIQ